MKCDRDCLNCTLPDCIDDSPPAVGESADDFLPWKKKHEENNDELENTRQP